MMIDKTILAATSASCKNPAALAALASIELSLSEPSNARSQSELDELVGKWARTLQYVDPTVVDGLTAQLRATRSSIDALVRSVKQAI